ncbi:MAG: hypothetical protein ACK5M3_18525 [Dysgonomonas sp.]
MKKLVISIILTFTILSCNENNNPQQAGIKRMYLVEYIFDVPEPPETKFTFYVNGLSEIDPFYNVVTTQRSRWRGDYHSTAFTLADSVRNRISGILDKYPRDTAFYNLNNEVTTRLYGGFYYFLWVERNDNSRILLDMYIPDDLPEDMQYVYRKVFEDYKGRKTGYVVTDVDSLQQYFSRFEKCLPENHISKPPAIIWDRNSGFQAPEITNTESSDDSEDSGEE